MAISATLTIDYSGIRPLQYAKKLQDDNSAILHVSDTLEALNSKHCNAYELELKKQLEGLDGYDYVLLIGPTE